MFGVGQRDRPTNKEGDDHEDQPKPGHLRESEFVDLPPRTPHCQEEQTRGSEGHPAGQSDCLLGPELAARGGYDLSDQYRQTDGQGCRNPGDYAPGTVVGAHHPETGDQQDAKRQGSDDLPDLV